MREWKEQTLVNQTLSFKGKNEVYALGLNLCLRHCELTIRCPSKCLIASGVNFLDCFFDIGRQLKSYPWCHCYFEDCRFTGNLVGHDFGRQSDPLWPQDAGIKRCNFSQARMDGCRFFNTDIDQVSLPGWPMFTIIDPITNGPILAEATWPDGMSSQPMERLARQPHGLSFLVRHAEQEVKYYGGHLASFKEKLAKFEFIRL